MAMTAGNAEIPGEFSVYESVIPADGAETLATVGGSNAIIAHRIGSGGVIFLAGEFGIRLPASYDNELRDRTVRILPSELSGGYARVLWETISQHALANRPLPAAVSTYLLAPRLMNSGVKRAAMMVAPSHGSTLSFLDAL